MTLDIPTRRTDSWSQQAARPSPHAVDLLWGQSSVIFVLASGELLAVIMSTSFSQPEGWLVRFGLYSFAIQWSVMFSLGLMYSARPWLRRQRPGVIVVSTLATILAVTLGSAVASYYVLSTFVPALAEDWTFSGLRLAICIMCMALLALVVFRGQWLTHQQRLRAQQAELDALRARVNPHFLFNSLNTATALVHDQPDQAERILLDLSDLFRAALSGNEETGIEQELLLTQHYLEIEALRLGDRLDVSWTLPTPLPAISVPALSLQTLAENAIHHGIEANPTGGRILIEVVQEAGKAVLRVSNPMPIDMPTLPRHQVGLAASRARIEAMTGGTGELRTRQDDGQFVAEIILPL